MLTRRTLLAGLATLPLARPAFARTSVNIPSDRLDAILGGRLEPFPGAGVAVGLWEEGRTRHRLVGSGIREDSVFQIGAVTKTFTATLLAVMVQRGEVGLDDTIDRYLRRGAKTPTFDDRKITLGDLATQTSGLPRSIATLDPSGNPLQGFTEENLYDFLGYYELKRPIGSQYETSNLGFGLLGYVLARRAGIDFATLLHERVLRPAGLASTGVTLTPAIRARMPAGRTWDGARTQLWDDGILAGGAGGYSTVADLLRFLDANVTQSGPIGAACKMAQAPRTATAFGHVGLAWNIEQADSTIWSNGLTGGFHAFLGISDDRKLGAVLLSNAAEAGIDEVGFHLVDPTLFALTPFPPVVAVPDAVLDRYLGTYRVLDGTIKILRLPTGFYAEIDNEHPLRIYPASPTKFFFKAIDAQIEFNVNDAGKCTDLTLAQRGITYEADRIGR